MAKTAAKGKRIYLVNRDFQLRYTRSALLVGLASSVLTLGLVLYPLVQFRIIRFPGFVPTPFLWAIGVAGVVNLGIIACLGVVLTHRIAGPMFSIVRHIHLMQRGHRVGPLRLRENDDLKYIVRNLNQLGDYLQELTQRDKTQVDALVEALSTGQTQEALALGCDLQNRLLERLTPAIGANTMEGQGQ